MNRISVDLLALALGASLLGCATTQPVPAPGSDGQASAPPSRTMPDENDMGRGPIEELAHQMSLSGLKIARSVVDANKIQDPAKFAWTDPDRGDSSYAIDVGLKMPVYPTAATRAGEGLPLDTQISLLAEYHRNNQIDKEQNSLRVGPTLEGVAGSTESGEGVLFAVPLTFKRDIVNSDERLQAAVRLIPVYDMIGTKLDYISSGTFGLPWRAGWQPTIGLEYDHTVHEKSGDVHGEVYRPLLGVAAGFYPWSREVYIRADDGSIKKDEFGNPTTKVVRPVQITGSLEYREDWGETGSLDNSRNRHRVYRFSTTYFLDRDEHFGIGVDYVNGDNPAEDLLFQRYWEVSIKILF